MASLPCRIKLKIMHMVCRPCVLWLLPTASAHHPLSTSLSSWNPAGFDHLPSVPWFSSSAYKALLDSSLRSTLLITLQSSAKISLSGASSNDLPDWVQPHWRAQCFVLSHALRFYLAGCTPLPLQWWTVPPWENVRPRGVVQGALCTAVNLTCSTFPATK